MQLSRSGSILGVDEIDNVYSRRKLRKKPPPYSHISTLGFQPYQHKGATKRKRRVLIKSTKVVHRDTLQPSSSNMRPSMSSTFCEHTQTQTRQLPLPQNSSEPKYGVLLPNLRPGSLWLERPTRPLQIRKSSQSARTLPLWGHRSGSYVISNSPILPIGGESPARSVTLRTEKPKSASPASARSPHIQTDLSKLIVLVESEFRCCSPPRAKSISTLDSLSVYSQPSARYSVLSEFDHLSAIISEGGNYGSDSSATCSSSPVAQTQTQSDNQYSNIDHSNSSTPSSVICFDTRPRSSASLTDTIPSTQDTLVDLNKPAGSKKHLDGQLTLQSCPSLASARRIRDINDLPPDQDAPSPFDKNTYRCYEHEGRVDSPFPFSDDLCADYDYIQAIDVLIYGTKLKDNHRQM